MVVSPCRVLCARGRARIDEQRTYRESVERHACGAPLLCAYSCTRSGAAGQGWRPPGGDHRVVDIRPRSLTGCVPQRPFPQTLRLCAKDWWYASNAPSPATRNCTRLLNTYKKVSQRPHGVVAKSRWGCNGSGCTMISSIHFFHNATALDITIDMLNPQPTLVQRLVGQLLL